MAQKITVEISDELKMRLEEMQKILAGYDTNSEEGLSTTMYIPNSSGNCTSCNAVCEVSCSAACTSGCVTGCVNKCGGKVIN